MDLQLFKQSRARLSLRRRPPFRGPIMNILVRFIHKLERKKGIRAWYLRGLGRVGTPERTLSNFVQLLGVHRAQILLCECVKEQVAL
jgi:hypothetical protein